MAADEIRFVGIESWPPYACSDVVVVCVRRPCAAVKGSERIPSSSHTADLSDAFRLFAHHVCVVKKGSHPCMSCQEGREPLCTHHFHRSRHVLLEIMQFIILPQRRTLSSLALYAGVEAKTI
jgi:hypothetical protein